MAIEMHRGVDCYKAISEVDAAIQDGLMAHQKYYVLGGIASGALRHPESVIDYESKSVIAAPDSADMTIRDNGTTRDIDILVNDVLNEESAELIKENVKDATGNSLVVSVFGVDEHTEATPTRRAKSAVKDWMSRRTIDAEGQMRYELYPLQQIVPAESYDPWRLELPDGQSVSILSPAGHMLAYAMRSISGIRAKDTEKLNDMYERVVADKNLKQDIVAGPFRPWLDFAVGMYDLRDGNIDPASPLLTESATRAERAAFRMKGKLLRTLEGQTAIVDFAQGERVQKILNVFVRAK